MTRLELANISNEVAMTNLAGLSPDVIIKWCEFSLLLEKKRADIIACIDKMRKSKDKASEKAESEYLSGEDDFVFEKFMTKANLAQLASTSQWKTGLFNLLSGLIVKEDAP